MYPNYNSKKYKSRSTVEPVGISVSVTGERVELTTAGRKLKSDRSPNGLLQSKIDTFLSNNACGKKLKVPHSVICTENDSDCNKDREYFRDVGVRVLEKEALVGVMSSHREKFLNITEIEL
ncbi:unnamed protein product [Pieris brassicae]|uniref:Uncharacterized protein n=1 Tax=Pieris brassicae TaxID=7116 RepID=A0A9P0SM57_PIEBR|nr:unnamed protein product [Pieris brassicae]